jgi:3-deoxy-manno-octulosonate cytidylyltransferase (CMP-KDO synthetase)
MKSFSTYRKNRAPPGAECIRIGPGSLDEAEPGNERPKENIRHAGTWVGTYFRRNYRAPLDRSRVVDTIRPKPPQFPILPDFQIGARMAALVIIPARLASTRLPRKLLLRETGRTVIEHTYRAARRAKLPGDFVVATDSEEILREVESFGGRAEMTSPDCPSGTDRVAEVVRRAGIDVEIVVNVQGDEPEIAGRSIDLAIEILERDPTLVMSTLATPIRTRTMLENPAVVKVVFDDRGRALYFSRSIIPHPREWDDGLLTAAPPCFFQHIGLYAYRRDFLLQLAKLPPARIEQIEKLEQLRVLDAGFEIGVGVVDEPTRGIDTPEDYASFVARIRSNVAAGA